MTHLFEYMGVLLIIEYTLDSDGVPEFTSVRATDNTYAPVGTEMLHLFNDMFIIESSIGNDIYIDKFLSHVAKQIDGDDYKPTNTTLRLS